jgi:IPT/TIG domain
MKRFRWFVALLATMLSLSAVGAGAACAGDRPIIKSVEPSSGPSAGGTELVLFGEPLENAKAVYFGKVRGKILHEECDGKCEIVPYTSLSVESPPHAPGTVNVIFENDQGYRSAPSPGDEFTYTTAPSITALLASRVRETSARLSARIHLHGLATSYTFWVKYDPCQHGAGECAKGPQTELVAEGALPAGDRAETVQTQLGNLQHGCLYSYWVVAKNSAGETESSRQNLETTGTQGLNCLR